MLLYIILYTIPLSFYLTYNRQKVHSTNFLALNFIIIALIVGLGDMLGGYDRYLYCEIFDLVADITTTTRDYRELLSIYWPSEWGWMYLNIAISFFTSNRYIFIFILTGILYFLVFHSIKRHSTNYPLSIVLFMGLWMFFTFTYLRQTLAATIAWLGYRYVIDKKMWKFLLVWYIAYRIHNSAIVFLIFYFVPMRKYPKNKVIIVMVILFLIGASGLSNSLYAIYANASDTFERAGEYGNEKGGARIAYLVEVIVFLYFIFTHYKHIPDDRQHLVMLNACFMFCGMLLLFISNSNAGRQSWFFILGIICIFTNLFGRKRAQKLQSTQYLIIIVSLLYLRILLAWNIQLYPYKTFLTNGARKNDHIWVEYEYDHRYDENKMYRDPWTLWNNIKKTIEDKK